MGTNGTHLGMQLVISELDEPNQRYFEYCAAHDFHLQHCPTCQLVRYPPTTACPWCGGADAEWVPVEGRGTVHSYTEVHHAIQGGFKAHVPYMILLVELDHQSGSPTPDEALRVVANLVFPDGTFADPDLVEKVGIGSRMRMVYQDVSAGLSLPQWALDDEVEQPTPWRCG